MNRSILLKAAVLASLTLAGSGAGAYSIHVRVNGQPVYFTGAGPRQVNGHVVVPLRGVLEQIGASVNWDPGIRTVFAHRGGTDIQLPIGSYTARVNGEPVRLDTPAMVIAGSAMVPLRFVSEALGADVRWRSASQTVDIRTNGGAVAYDSYRPIRAHVTRGATVRYVLPTGTVIPVRLNDTLSSDSSQPGDRFSVTVRPGGDNAGLPDGTRIQGVVRDAEPATGDHPGTLDLDFRRAVFPDGESFPMEGSLISLQSNSVRRASDGRLVARSDKERERLKFIGIGAAGGLVIGSLSKNNQLLSTLIGAGLGYLYNEVRNQRPANVRVGSGTEFGVRLDRQLVYSAAAGRYDEYR